MNRKMDQSETPESLAAQCIAHRLRLMPRVVMGIYDEAMRAEGVEVRPLRQLNGGTHFNEVFLNQVRVPDTDRLGPEASGWKVAMTTLMNERMAIGGLDRLFSFDALLEHAREHGFKRIVGRLPDNNEPALSFLSSIGGLVPIINPEMRFELPL